MKSVKLVKILIFAFRFAALAFACVRCTSASVYTVCPSGCDYSGIQVAIDAPTTTAGDTIEVHSGTYYENVVVNKKISLKGYDTGDGKPIVDAQVKGNAFTLSADGVGLDGFKVINSGGLFYPASGILVDSNSNTIINNTVSNNWKGITFSASSNNILTDNNVSNNGKAGIWLYYFCNNNTITGNTGTNCQFGIWIESSIYNVVVNNTFSNNTYRVVYLLRSTRNNNIADNTVCNNKEGIRLYSSNDNTIENNTVSNNRAGIRLKSSGNNTVSGNNANNNTEDGIKLLQHSNYNIVINNTACNNNDGIVLSLSNNNTVTGSTASNNSGTPSDNGRGIFFTGSHNNIVATNNASNNVEIGISIHNSRDNTISGNIVNNNRDGIELADSHHNVITDNTVSNNLDCIELSFSRKNTITGNNACNNRYGIKHYKSSHSKIFLNNFINNTNNGYSVNSYSNIWHSKHKLTYTYRGNIFTSYLGNYWSNYNDTDTNEDGIWDSPYKKPRSNVFVPDKLPRGCIRCGGAPGPYAHHPRVDYYPLVEPRELYMVLTELPVHNVNTRL